MRASILCAVVFSLVSSTLATYLTIVQPTTGTQFTNNVANAVVWEKGLLDGLNSFDVEMARMSQDGLFLVARNVPALSKQLNLLLLDVPAGDDYFLIFINSTHGVMHATSPRFTVLAPGSSPSGSATLSSAPNAPTVTVSGTPNPTLSFATTFPAVANGAVSLTGLHQNARATHVVLVIVLTLVSGAFGAVWTVL